jgi:hypothetical protein
MPRFLMVSNLWKSEFIDDAKSPMANRRKPRVKYSRNRQTGKRISLEDDKKRTALPPGKRVSKTGKVYYEYRKNRTDIKGLNI